MRHAPAAAPERPEGEAVAAKRQAEQVILLVEAGGLARQQALEALRNMDAPPRLVMVETPEAIPRALRAQPTPSLVLLGCVGSAGQAAAVVGVLREQPVGRRLPLVLACDTYEADFVAVAYETGCNCVVPRPESVDAWARLLERLRRYWFETVILPEPGE